MFGKCLGTFMFHMQQMKTLQGWVVVVFTYDQNCQKVGRNGNCQNNCLQKIHVLHPWRLTWNTKMAVDGNLFSWFLGSVLIFQGVNGKGLFHGPFNNYTFFIISSALLQLNLFWGTAREYNFNSKQPTNFPPPWPSCKYTFPCSQLVVPAPDENSWPWRLQRSRRATSARRDDPTTLPPGEISTVRWW